MYSKSISKRSLNIITLSIAVSVFSQNTKNSSVQTENSRKDSTKLTIVKEERNVMLNASDANAPREIPIGLPSTFVNVYENGMPAVYSSVLYNVSANWRNESSLASLGLMDPIESAISTGNVAYSVTSKSHLGTENQRGIINYAINHRGLQQFDINNSGSLGNGWLYSATMYQIFDTGTQKWRFTNFYDRTQMYKGAITKKFNNNKGQVSLLYKYIESKKAANMDSQGPFIYVGDGTIKEANNFHLGTSSYVPGNGEIQYMDLLTGNIYKDNFRNNNYNQGNDVSLLSEYNFDNGMKLNLNIRYLKAKSREVARGFSTITNVVNGLELNGENLNLYYDMDGNLFTGKKQLAIAYQHIADINNFFITSELAKKTEKHHWKIGFNEWLYKVDYHSNTSMYDTTVEPYPSFIYHITPDGEKVQYFNYNIAGSEYHIGHENKTALYFVDKWKPLNKLIVNYGGRLEYYNVAGENLPYERFNDFHIGTTAIEGGSIKPVRFDKSYLNYAASLQAEYNITDNFGVVGDITLTRLHPPIDNYASFSNPKDDAIKVNLFRGGIFYKNSWLNLTSMVTQIEKSNFYTLINVANPQNNTESKTTAFNYNIKTLGWTTTAELDPLKGFHLHLLLTLQKPEYDNYETILQFGNLSYPVSASGKTVIGIPKVIAEFDPSYTFNNDKLKLWMSIRYYGKQYANLSNALYFNGRFESFAGVDYKLNQHLSFSGSVVNFLNQTGATGMIAGAELITPEEASKFNNSWMTGYFLRPFILQFGAKYQF